MNKKYEEWEVEAQQRAEKDEELEKRLLGFQDQYENGDLTEEEYRTIVDQEKNFMEPTATWEPIDPIPTAFPLDDQEMIQDPETDITL